MSTITKERLQRLIRAIDSGNYDEEEIVGWVNSDEILEMARIALASLEAEPVAFVMADDLKDSSIISTPAYRDLGEAMERTVGDMVALYTAPPAPADAEPVAWLWSHRKHPSEVSLIRPEDDERAEVAHWSGWNCQALYAAPPAPVSMPKVPNSVTAETCNLDEIGHDWNDAEYYAQGWNACRAAMLQGAEPVTTAYKLPEETGSSLQLRNLIRQRHSERSQATFGDVGPVGPLKHLSKEALEAAAEPDDLSEWADMQFLLWDAQRRAGISDGEITAAMEEKLKVNMARQWPEPKDGEPRLHIKEAGNSPVIPDWQAQAEKRAELYGSSFVLFRNGESPQCADPTKVIISFTDEGLGHGSAAPQPEVK